MVICVHEVVISCKEVNQPQVDKRIKEQSEQIL